ncbi:MAG: hypothetical protein ACREQY_23625, partial [Candidatus Binatia bacterium]
VSKIREYLEVGDSWHRLVAAGLYARLIEPSSPEESRKLIDDHIAGRPNPLLVRPIAWVRSLSPTQLDDIEELALAEVDRLHGLVESLAESIDCEDPAWRGKVLELCHLRDDLEGTHSLLGEARRGDRLALALDGLDRDGDLFTASIPREIRFEDERLRRVRLGDPLAWWADLAGD